MNRKLLWTILGVAAIVGFVAFGANAFKGSLTPYVSIKQAKVSQEAVQVSGKLVLGSEKFDESTSRLFFTLEDDHGETMRVAYRGLRPGNFEEATLVVAIGRYQSGVLEAEKLLVKCPSKYQGINSPGGASRSS